MEMPSSLMPPRKVSSHQQFVNLNLLHGNPVILYVLVHAFLLILHPTKCASVKQSPFNVKWTAVFG